MPRRHRNSGVPGGAAAHRPLQLLPQVTGVPGGGVSWRRSFPRRLPEVPSFANGPIDKRYISIPLGLVSSSVDRSQAEGFLSLQSDKAARLMLMKIHVIGLDEEQPGLLPEKVSRQRCDLHLRCGHPRVALHPGREVGPAPRSVLPGAAASGGWRAALGTTQRGAGDGHAQPQQRSLHFRAAAGATGSGCPEALRHHGDGHALPVLCFLLPGSRAGGGRGRVPETAWGEAKGADSHDDPRGVT